MEPASSSVDGPRRDDANGSFSTPPSSARTPSADTAKDRYWLHLLLFVLTLGSTVYAGADWAARTLYYEEVGYWAQVVDGFRYAVPLLLFLTVHEFGHYFAARYHGINTSLPYYIPFPFNGIGNFGAVISIREPIPSTRKLFDVGAAGPLAGFVVAFAVLVYAMATLPGPEYLLDLAGHEALKEHIQQYGAFPEAMLASENGDQTVRIVVGDTLLYWLLAQVFSNVPPMYEMYHYPVLFAGWLGLFFTALNLLPVGQLDGGHILYALFGKKWHGRLARGFVVILLISGGIGFMDSIAPALYEYSTLAGHASWMILAGILYFYLNRTFQGAQRYIAPVLLGILLIVAVSQVVPAMVTHLGYTGWLVWTLLIVLFIRVEHPPVVRPDRLTPRRRLLGYASILIFVLCFSLRPIYIA
ncbi:MAG: site-2 protease family protein [Bacteroidetes bacterium]|nr:site-2 protease family protein [Bacteroidota bacterium]